MQQTLRNHGGTSLRHQQGSGRYHRAAQGGKVQGEPSPENVATSSSSGTFPEDRRNLWKAACSRKSDQCSGLLGDFGQSRVFVGGLGGLVRDAPRLQTQKMLHATAPYQIIVTVPGPAGKAPHTNTVSGDRSYVSGSCQTEPSKLLIRGLHGIGLFSPLAAQSALAVVLELA